MKKNIRDQLRLVQDAATRFYHSVAENSPEYAEYGTARFSHRRQVVVKDWHSPEGQERLLRSKFKQAFFNIAHAYQAQINPFYCGVACMAMVLNSLRLNRGMVPNQEGFDYETPGGRHIQYKYYSQLTVLNEKTERVKRKIDIAPSLRGKHDRPAEEDFNPGLELHEMKAMLETYDMKVKMVPAVEELEQGLPFFTSVLKEVLNDPNKILVVNFEGMAFGAKTGGHYSIVGAYDEVSDSVLILDTAAHKNPWYWVPTKHLYHGMNTESSGGYTRGYLIAADTIVEH